MLKVCPSVRWEFIAVLITIASRLIQQLQQNTLKYSVKYSEQVVIFCVQLDYLLYNSITTNNIIL